jgi:hypothetical protein
MQGMAPEIFFSQARLSHIIEIRQLLLGQKYLLQTTKHPKKKKKRKKRFI